MSDLVEREAVYRLVDDIIDNLCENSVDLGALESWGREQVMELPSVTNKSETVTEFADRCKECGARYGKLLKQELCKDAISRQAVLSKKIYTETEEGWSGYTVNADYIEQLPPVTIRKTQMVDKSNFDVNQYKVDIDTAYECGKASKRQTGKWRYVREDKYSCSKCGTTTRVDESGIDEKPMYKFCPHCGAEMVGEKE